MLPQTEQLSSSRRAMDIEDYLDVARRHRSWILAPAFAGLVIGVVTAFLWPNTYVSMGAVRVVPPQVSQKLVPSNISEQLVQRINAMYQGITSRPSLTNLIQVYNLYPAERKRMPTEDVLELMRKDIRMSPLLGITKFNPREKDSGIAFSISYAYAERKKAEQVCRELITQFINESIRFRSSQSVSTTEFFKDQMETARKDLQDSEKRITDFRMKDSSEVGEAETSVWARISALENNAAGLNLSISRANQDKLQAESNLRSYREQLVMASAPPPSTPEQAVVARKNERIIEIDKEIYKLEASYNALRQTYKDDYPDLQRLRSIIAARRQERETIVAADEVARATQSAPDAPKPATPPQIAPYNAAGTGAIPYNKDTRDLAAKMAQAQSLIQAKDLEVEDLNKQLSEVRKRIAGLQSRLETTPAAQQAYQQLLRDRDMAAMRYAGLNAKMQESNLASDLENRQQGETLQLLEEPNVPQVPSAPKRLPIVLGGLGGGVILGLILAGFREIKDTSLKNLKDVRSYTKLMVLGSIPLLENDLVVRRRRRLGLVAWSAAFLVGILLMSGSVYYYFTTNA